MSQNTILCCHAPALSSLLFETVCCTRNQKGLLLGSRKTHTNSTITDDPEVQHETKTLIYVENSVMLPDELFSHFGRINEEDFLKWIEPFKDKLLGWFNCRPSFKSLKASMHDVFLHKILSQFVAPQFKDSFVFGLLSTGSTYPWATHSFHYAFYRICPQAGCFVEFPLKVYNLSDKFHNESGYQPHNNIFPEAETFRTFDLDSAAHKKENVTDLIHKYHKESFENLQKLCDTLYSLEKEEQSLQAEVTKFRHIFVQSKLPPAIATNNVEIKKKVLTSEPFLGYNSLKDFIGGDSENVLLMDEDNDNNNDETKMIVEETEPNKADIADNGDSVIDDVPVAAGQKNETEKCNTFVASAEFVVESAPVKTPTSTRQVSYSDALAQRKPTSNFNTADQPVVVTGNAQARNTNVKGTRKPQNSNTPL